MDEFCSAIRYSNQRFHVDRSEDVCVIDQVGISCEDSWCASYENDLVCAQCGGEEEGCGIASPTSQRANSSISGSADEATDDWDDSVFYYGFYIFLYSLNARSSQWVGI